MIRLEPITKKNFGTVVDMKLPPEQTRFVAPNIVSMAQAWLYYDTARPMAIMEGDEIVGFLMLSWDADERAMYIWRFMIAYEQQRKGYGRQALEVALQMARDDGGIDVVYLDYVPGNDAARSLYYSAGFRENGEVDDGEIIMVLPLTDSPKVSALTADEDDLEDFEKLIGDKMSAGAPVPQAFADPDALKKAVADEKVTRLTLMAKTIGLAMDGDILLADEHQSRMDEARTLSTTFTP